MTIAHFDCFSGISGDMTLGALLDLGVDEEELRRRLGGLGLRGYELVVERKSPCGIHGTDVNVKLLDEGSFRCHRHERSGDSHDRGHGCGETNLRSIERLIEESDLPESVKDLSTRVFREIARAEGAVHGVPAEDVHFHEVGAVDSIVDIVGTAICIDMLGIGSVTSSPLRDGRGFVECRHGTIPVPVPAVMEMLKGSGIHIIQDDVATELVTPTGLGIIKSIASGFGLMPPMKVEKVGYGLGKRGIGRPNALRIVMGSPAEAPCGDEVLVLETNIDDSTPEVLGYAMERLLERGALDVFYTPVYMKKNRPAAMLTVLCSPRDEEAMEGIIFAETSTIGLRRTLTRRLCMERETATVATAYGLVRVKIARWQGVTKVSPEYEDLKAMARATDLPIAHLARVVQEIAGSPGDNRQLREESV